MVEVCFLGSLDISQAAKSPMHTPSIVWSLREQRLNNIVLCKFIVLAMMNKMQIYV